MLKSAFSRSIGRPGAPLHFAAHSHHPWPDVTFAAQMQCWVDAAELLDRKWDKVFGEVVPAAQRHVADLLGLADPSSVVFAPNTHELVKRLLSCLPVQKPSILTSDSEFHSFTRQVARLEEDGLVEVVRIAAEPFSSFNRRFAEAAAQRRFDLVFVSQVFFNSGFAIDPAQVIAAVKDSDTFIVIDGYHSFMAWPGSFRAWQSRAFFLAGGYKYAMAGEGVCFMHCPPVYGPRPRDTGWYAEFGALAGARRDEVGYGEDGSRFAGSTFDPSGLYRFNAVQDWLKAMGGGYVDVVSHQRYCWHQQQQFLDRLPSILQHGSLVPIPSARFLTFVTDQAGAIEAALAERDIIVDRRGDRLRIGFGVYQDQQDLERLLTALEALS